MSVFRNGVGQGVVCLVAVLALAPGASAQEICNSFFAEGTLNIPGGNGNAPGDRVWTLDIATPGIVTDVNVLDLWGNHDSISDLSFRLQSPAGTTVTLLPRSCGSVVTDFDIGFDDEGAAGPPPCPYNDAQNYQPLESLAGFDGQSMAGTWSLFVNDAAAGGGGRVSGWGLELCYEAEQVDLAVTKDDGMTEAAGGDTLVYTIVVTNSGPNKATSATVEDLLPPELTNASWTCTPTGFATCTEIGVGNILDTVDLPVGDTLTYILTATVMGAAGVPIVNTVTVSALAGVLEADDSDNSASDTDSIVGLPHGELGTVARYRRGLAAITQLFMDFDEDMAASAGQTTSYLLVGAGVDGVIETIDCTGVAGDDTAIGLEAASYDDTVFKAHLWVNAGLPLDVADYGLIACGLTDVGGSPLDSDGDGVGDSEALMPFLVKVDHLLEDNPNFDGDVAGWTTSTPTVGSIDWDAEDVAGVSTSGSLSMDGGAPGDGPWTATQCIAADATEVSFRLLASVQVAGTVDASATAVLYDGPGCSGTAVHTLSTPVVGADTGGAWVDLASPFHRLSQAGAVTALVTLEASPAAAGSWTILWDEVAVWGASIFHGDFETGDVSQWSGSTP